MKRCDNSKQDEDTYSSNVNSVCNVENSSFRKYRTLMFNFTYIYAGKLLKDFVYNMQQQK